MQLVPTHEYMVRCNRCGRELSGYKRTLADTVVEEILIEPCDCLKEPK